MALGAALALALPGAPARAMERPDPDHYLFQDPADVDEEGKPRPMGNRVPVIFVHGMTADDLVPKRETHVTFSILGTMFHNDRKRGHDPFEKVYPLHYNYAPYKPYEELADDFVARLLPQVGDRNVIILCHSAGALLARWTAGRLPIVAVVGIAPAHGGSPGASLCFTNRKIVTEGPFEEEHFETAKETHRTVGLPDDVLRSVAWDNSDGVVSERAQKEWGVYVQPPLPPFEYARLDHYGVFHHFVAMFGGLDFLQQKKGKSRKDIRQREWECVGAFSKKWKKNDGVIVPYPESEADNGYPTLAQRYAGIGHRELFLDKEVVGLAWAQVIDVAGQVLEE